MTKPATPWNRSIPNFTNVCTSCNPELATSCSNAKNAWNSAIMDCTSEVAMVEREETKSPRAPGMVLVIVVDLLN